MLEPIAPITPFRLWEPPTWVIPKMYWDSMSQEQRIHAICRQIEKLMTYADYLGVNTDELVTMYNELQAEFTEFKEHGFEDYYKTQVEQWISDNLSFVFEEVAKQVYFGLTDDGHFVAYIPDSWDDIIFDTGYNFGDDTYGRLILRWNVNNAHPVTQTPYEENHNGKEI